MGKSGRTIREMKKMLYLLVIRQKLTHISLAFARKQALILGCPGIRNMHIRHLHISYNAPYLPPPHPPPPKKKKNCVILVFNFSWGGCNTQKKCKTKVMQNLGVQFDKTLSQDHVQPQMDSRPVSNTWLRDLGK